MSITRPEPQSPEAERAVLASLLIDRDVILRIAPMLKPEDFYQSPHQTLYACLLRLYQQRIPADLVTVTAALGHKDRGGVSDLERVGGMAYLSDLHDAVPTAVHAEYYADIVRKAAVRRRYIQAGSTIIEAAWDETTDLESIAATASEALLSTAVGNVGSGYVSMADAVAAMMADLDHEKRHERVVKTGYRKLDEHVGGFLPGQLVVVGARPGVGKTSFGVQISYQTSVVEKRPIGFLSLEMAPLWISSRHTAIASGVNMHHYRQLKDPPFDMRKRVTDAAGVVSNAPIKIIPKVDGQISTVMAQARDLHARYGITCFIVDYLQLMHGRRTDNRTQEVAEISRSLKLLAMDLEIPVIALAQLNRAVETRGKKAIPQLSDLRESGSIEQDADIVIFIHQERDDDTVPKPMQESWFLIAKHREGPSQRSIEMLYRTATAQFVEPAQRFREVA